MTKNNEVNKKKTARKSNLPPLDPQGVKFCSIFNCGWEFIVGYKKPGDEKLYWYTEKKYPIHARALWERYRDPEQMIGVRFGRNTFYGMSDIDTGSPYHPANDRKKFDELLHTLETIGITRYLIIQSSMSGGIHIYYFFDEAVRSIALACAVRDAYVSGGFTIKDGWLEVFPNPKHYDRKNPTQFKAHRLPLQKDSYILDSDLNPETNDVGEFLSQVDWVASGQDMQALASAMDEAYQKQKSRYVGRKVSGGGGRVARWREDWTTVISTGFTGHGQTNNLIGIVAGFGRVFVGLEGNELIEYTYQQVINLPGYKQWSRHQHEIREKCIDWARCAEKYYKPLTDYPEREITYKEMYEQMGMVGKNRQPEKNNIINFVRKSKTENKLQQVIKHLQKINNIPNKVRDLANTIMNTSKELFGTIISKATLYKQEYLQLWHPSYTQNIVQPEVNQGEDESPVPTPPPVLNSLSQDNQDNIVQPEVNQGEDESPVPTPPPVLDTENPILNEPQTRSLSDGPTPSFNEGFFMGDLCSEDEGAAPSGLPKSDPLPILLNGGPRAREASPISATVSDPIYTNPHENSLESPSNFQDDDFPVEGGRKALEAEKMPSEAMGDLQIPSQNVNIIPSVVQGELPDNAPNALNNADHDRFCTSERVAGDTIASSEEVNNHSCCQKDDGQNQGFKDNSYAQVASSPAALSLKIFMQLKTKAERRRILKHQSDSYRNISLKKEDWYVIELVQLLKQEIALLKRHGGENNLRVAELLSQRIDKLAEESGL